MSHEKTIITIVVSGGVVQEAFANQEAPIELRIIDFDADPNWQFTNGEQAFVERVPSVPVRTYEHDFYQTAPQCSAYSCEAA